MSNSRGGVVGGTLQVIGTLAALCVVGGVVSVIVAENLRHQEERAEAKRVAQAPVQLPPPLSGEEEPAAPPVGRGVRPRPGASSLPELASNIIEKYGKNELAGDDLWKGFRATILGEVKMVRVPVAGDPYVALSGDGMLKTLRCGISPSQRSAFTNIEAGQMILVRANGKGMSLGSVYFDECELVEVLTLEKPHAQQAGATTLSCMRPLATKHAAENGTTAKLDEKERMLAHIDAKAFEVAKARGIRMLTCDDPSVISIAECIFEDSDEKKQECRTPTMRGLRKEMMDFAALLPDLK
jgi:hypothetical protein